MKSIICRAMACLGLGLALLVPAPIRADEPFYKAIPYVRLLEKYGFYEPFIDLALEPVLAAAKTQTVVKIALGVPQSSARLEVYKFSGSIHAEGGDTCWLGNNRVKLTVPVDFRYEIDLGQLKPKDLHYDPARNVLEVKLPPVTLAKVLPDYAGMEVVEKINPTFRSPLVRLEGGDPRRTGAAARRVARPGEAQRGQPGRAGLCRNCSAGSMGR